MLVLVYSVLKGTQRRRITMLVLVHSVLKGTPKKKDHYARNGT